MRQISALQNSIVLLAAIIAMPCAPTLSRAALVAAWGDNAYGQTRLPVGANNVKAIAGGDEHSLALKSDGSVVAWRLNNQGQTNVPSGLTNVKAVAAGSLHSLALKVNGSVVAWGDNSNGETNVPVGLVDAIAVAAGANHSLALKADGSVVAWGNNSYGQTNIPFDLSNVVAIAAGSLFKVALKADGTVVTWGENYSGQANVPAGLSSIAGATNQTLSLPFVGRKDRGLYAVLAANAGGTTLSRNATLAVRVPQRLQAPVRVADGSWLVTSGDADGGALLAEDLAALEVQASTNFVNWVTVPGVPTLTNGSLRLHDPGSTNFPVRFYRMVEH